MRPLCPGPVDSTKAAGDGHPASGVLVAISASNQPPSRSDHRPGSHQRACGDQRYDLAKFHAPLVKTVHIPDEAADNCYMLIERKQLAKNMRGCEGQLISWILPPAKCQRLFAVRAANGQGSACASTLFRIYGSAPVASKMTSGASGTMTSSGTISLP